MLDHAWSDLLGLAASQHGAFTRRQAASYDISHRRLTTALRNGLVAARGSTVFVVAGQAESFEQRLATAVLTEGSAVASHRSAARLHRFDGFERSTTLEVSVDRRHRWQHGGGVVAHHVTPLEATDLTVVDGIRCTTVARTIADIGSVVPSFMVGRALTDLRRRGVPLLLLRDTAARLHRPGQSGTGRLLAHLDAVPAEGRVPDSWFEELLARCIAHPGIPDVVVQCPIYDANGRVVARVDLGIPDVRLGLEAHSRRFHFGPEREALDEDRDLRAAACGWELLYLGWYAVQRPAVVARRIAEVVAMRRRDLRAA